MTCLNSAQPAERMLTLKGGSGSGRAGRLCATSRRSAGSGKKSGNAATGDSFGGAPNRPPTAPPPQTKSRRKRRGQLPGPTVSPTARIVLTREGERRAAIIIRGRLNQAVSVRHAATAGAQGHPTASCAR